MYPKISLEAMSVVPAPFRYAFRGDRAVDTLLIGGGLHLVAVFVPVIPIVVVLGYLVRTLEEISARERTSRFESLPRFRTTLSMVRTGIGSSAILLGYALPAAMTLLVTVTGLSNRSIAPESIGFGTSTGFVIGSTTSLLLAVFFLYLLPAALLNYARRGRLRAAVDLEFLQRAATDGGYFYNIVTGIVVGALLLTVAGALTGVAIGFFVAFYAEVVTVGFWCRGTSSLVPTETVPETTDSLEAA